jgi:hypothetical protein
MTDHQGNYSAIVAPGLLRLAAFAEGIAWLVLCLTGMHTFQRHRVEKRVQASGINGAC